MLNFAHSTKHQPLSFIQILKYWIPEAASAACLIFLPIIFDLLLVAKLKSTTTFSAIGMSSNLIHTLVKLAEALSVAGIAIIGRFNGANKFADCRKSFFDMLVTTSVLGLLQLLAVMLGANSFMHWIEAPESVRHLAIPFLKAQTIAIFFAFVFMAFLSFFKAVKDTKTPFLINMFGISLFLLFDYGLIFGKFGLPEYGYLGSAIASNIRYIAMIICSIVALICHPGYKVYFQARESWSIHPSNIVGLLKMSAPIMIDKTILSFSYIWLAKMVAPLGICAIACMDVVKNVERLAFIPAMAFAQIITFVVSNNLGAGSWQKAKANIKRILVIAIAVVSASLFLVCYFSEWLVSFLDPNNNFSAAACIILRAVSPLVIFDLIQLILAGALRGAGDVNTVMLTRLISCSTVFLPLSYLISKHTHFASTSKIILIYGSFYLTTAIIGIVLMHRLQGHQWYKVQMPDYQEKTGAAEAETLVPTPNDASNL